MQKAKGKYAFRLLPGSDEAKTWELCTFRPCLILPGAWIKSKAKLSKKFTRPTSLGNDNFLR